MMMLYPRGQHWGNAACSGVLHNAYVDAGIPCFTPEVGAARRLDLDMIPRCVAGTMNAVKHYGLIPGAVGRTAADANGHIGNSAFAVLITQGGCIELVVKLNDKVTPGQKVAVQRNAFGEVLAEYTSPVHGRIGGLHGDATSEPGNVLMSILSSGAPEPGARRYLE